MSTERYIARATDVAARRVGDELMIMTGRTSELFSLNETAAVLWDAADGETTIQQIVSTRILPVFDVDPDTALRDAETLAMQLAGHGIFTLADAPIPGTAR